MTLWDRLARFQTEDGQAYWATLELHETEITIGARIIGFVTIEDLEKDRRGKSVVVNKVLAPIPSPENPIICLGGNYKAHIEEAKVPSPSVPACMWLKSRYALAHHNSPIPIPKHAYENFLDYEGELVIVTAKDALNVSVEDASQYILGYTCGNDLTARGWHEIGRSSMQLGFAKGYDSFSPMGPSLISRQAWNSAGGGKHLKTFVNGKVVQDAALDTMTFSPEKIVSFLSQGHTLAGGSAIMTGTPLGVGFFSDPQYSLKDGDTVQVEITPIGTLKNTMKYE